MNGREAWRRLKRFVGPQYLVEPPPVEGTFEESQILIWVLDLRPEDSEPMHPRSQGTRVEAQDRCSPVLSLDARSVFPQFPGISLYEGLDH